MLTFLIPLLPGFTFNLVSTFTTAFSRRWGSRRGTLATAILRNVTGIPLWGLGFIMAFATPTARVFKSSSSMNVLGWLLLGIGALIICVALFSIRASAAAPSISDALVDRGMYAWVRHPIHAGTLLEFTGLFFIRPTLAVTLACGLGIVWVLLQTRFEERDLLQRLPEYADYKKRVPAYFPGLKRG